MFDNEVLDTARKPSYISTASPILDLVADLHQLAMSQRIRSDRYMYFR